MQCFQMRKTQFMLLALFIMGMFFQSKGQADFGRGRGWGGGYGWGRPGRPGEGRERDPGRPGDPSPPTNEEVFSGGCLGGRVCPNRYFIVNFSQGRTVQSIQFFANDRVGDRHTAVLNLFLDNILVAQNIDIKQDGFLHSFNVNNIFARSLRFEAVADDEAQIDWIKVTYVPQDSGRGGDGRDGDGERDRDGRDRDRGDRGSEQMFFPGGCIGGACRRSEIAMNLDDQGRGPVFIESLDFFASDRPGPGNDAIVDILVDNFIVVRGVSIRSLRSNYHIPINQRGQFVRIVAYDAEVRLGTVTVNFSRRGWGRR
ncbi:MAG: hypothetical protein K1X29_09330 [Bdellovibrionales bacterium]|nr:hypothetical protein [Bdellovibrionales bacterium]